jgi:hypothetical protein
MRAIETVLSGGVFALPQSVAPAGEPEATHLAVHLIDRQIEVFHLLSQSAPPRRSRACSGWPSAR